MSAPGGRARVVRELAAYLRPGVGPCGDPVSGWPALLDIAADHQLLPALWSALHARGVRALPEGVGGDRSPLRELERAHAINAARVRDLRSQAVLVLDALDDAGIDAIAIKGLHWLLAGWQRDPASRVLVDIDILIPRPLARDAQRALELLGYAPVPGAPRDDLTLDHQLVALAAPGHRGSVELHVAPIAPAYAKLLTADELFDAAEVQIIERRERRLPNATHAMVLLIAHAQLQDGDARLLRLPLRALRDLAVLVDEGHGTADWDAVGGRFRGAGEHAAIGLAGFAAAAEALFGLQIDVPRRRGAGWLHATQWAIDHDRTARTLREIVSLPRALRPERMHELYGASGAASVAAARVRHLSGGATRRIARTLSRESATV